MLAQQFQADARVWKVLTVLSRSIVPATELNSALLEHRGPISKWLAVHANVEHGGFTVYEKVNDCDAEAGYERGIARHDTYESAISDIYDRALVSSLQEVAPDCGNF